MRVNSLHWYYIPSLGNIGDEVILEGDEWHHCLHVLRMQVGSTIILTDGKGNCMEGIIRSTTAKTGRIELTEDLSTVFRNPRQYKVRIGMAPTKNIDRTEYAIEKLTEIGVDEITFLDCHHSERSHLRLDRIQKILVAAAKQSRKTFFPPLSGPVLLAKYIGRIKEEFPQSKILTCHMDAESMSISENYLAGEDVVLLIGPEGGFSATEIEMMKKEQVKLAHLGPFRLRVETAAITAAVTIHLINEIKLQ